MVNVKGPKNDPGNYRPVSLTSVPCKIMEGILRDHLLDHVDTNHIISVKQHGFVRGRSCLTNLLETLEEWTSALDKGYGIDAIHVDYRKAFDTVPHKTRHEIAKLWNRWKAVEMVKRFFNS